jgi:hypothetical protein
MSETISVRAPSLQANARKVVKQIEALHSPDPIMRLPCADREEKRGPAGTTHPETMTDQEQLDRNDPNQRRLLAPMRQSLYSTPINSMSGISYTATGALAAHESAR